MRTSEGSISAGWEVKQSTPEQSFRRSFVC